MRIILIILVVFAVVESKSQPPLNQWYDLGGAQSVINSIHPTDSCYYFTGIVHFGVAPISWNLVFGKMDFDGNILEQTNYGSDTINIYGINCNGSNLLSTLDGNFATMTYYDDIFFFLKFDPNGDTIKSSIINHFLVDSGFEARRPSKILQLPSDSSYYCAVTLQHGITLESRLGLIHLNKQGVILGHYDYPISQPGFEYFEPRSLLLSDDGLLISSEIIKPISASPDYRSRTVLLQTDFSGNEQWRWIDIVCEADEFPSGLTQTSDGGFLYAGTSGQYHPDVNGQQYVASITKLDASLNKEWKIGMGDSISSGWINMTDIKHVENDRYVASGFWYAGDSAVIGSMINFNTQGEVLWDSYFTLIPALDQASYPWHELYEIDVTPDGGFLMVGQAQDWIALNNGIPGSFGWVVKTDSVGCLVPGCQDFFSIDEIESSNVKVTLYPNPTSNFLNIYYNDPNFNGNTTMQIFDLQGKLLREWGVTINDITFMYDVSTLNTGAYVLRVTKNGVETFMNKFIVD